MDVGLAQCIHMLNNLLGMIPRGLTIPVISEPPSSNCWMISEFLPFPFLETGTKMDWAICMNRTSFMSYTFLQNPAWGHHPLHPTVKELGLREAMSLTQSHKISCVARIWSWVCQLQNLPSFHFITLKSQSFKLPFSYTLRKLAFLLVANSSHFSVNIFQNHLRT